MIRLNNDYGRSNKRYEEKKYFKPFNKNTVVFGGYFKNDKYKLNKKNIYLNEIRKSEDIILEVRASNNEAQALYHKLKFKSIGIRRGYYESENGREDAYVLKLSL